MDVWGKYWLTSINGNQYYIVFIDDVAQYITINFMKAKSKVVQKVKNYLTHLKTQEKLPKAIRFDCGKEFLNEELRTWCAQCYNFRRLRQSLTVIVSKVRSQMSLEECKSWTCIVLLGLRVKVQVKGLSIKD